MEGPLIRDMSPADLGEVQTLEETSFTTPWSRASFKFEVANDETILKVAVINEHIIGYVCLRTILDITHVLNLVVTPEFRRKETGIILLRSAIEDLRRVKPDVRNLTLEVRESNYAAIGLYEKCGFLVTGRRTGYYQRPSEDAVIMDLNLPQWESGNDKKYRILPAQ
jgi:ribosomal-protein-alanine N-acetyltransferase